MIILPYKEKKVFKNGSKLKKKKKTFRNLSDFELVWYKTTVKPLYV